MCAWDGAGTHIHARANPAVNVKRVATHRCTYNVHDGIYRPDLVEVNRLDRNTVNACLRFSEQFERADGRLAGDIGDVGVFQQVSDDRQRSAMRMLVAMVRIRPVVAYMARMRLSLGRMGVPVSVRGCSAMTVRVLASSILNKLIAPFHHYIHFGRAYTAAIGAGNAQLRPELQRTHRFLQ